MEIIYFRERRRQIKGERKIKTRSYTIEIASFDILSKDLESLKYFWEKATVGFKEW